MFGTSMGNYKMSDFKTLAIGELVGQFFTVLAVLINSIVLVNFIIAILADTYSKLSI